MDAQEIGTMIQRLREQQNLTQKALAERLAVSDKTISKWETGRGLPDMALFQPLAEALQVSISELFSGVQIVNQNRSGNLKRKPEKDGLLCLSHLRKCAVLDGRRCFQLLRHFAAEVTGRASDRHTYTHHSTSGL